MLSTPAQSAQPSILSSVSIHTALNTSLIQMEILDATMRLQKDTLNGSNVYQFFVI